MAAIWSDVLTWGEPLTWGLIVAGPDVSYRFAAVGPSSWTFAERSR